MIRVEPFTTYALEYGGGEFDYPDRMFNDAGKTFANTVRELVPEFYCLPEMFVNENRFGFLSKDAPSSNSSGLVDKGVGDVYHNTNISQSCFFTHVPLFFLEFSHRGQKGRLTNLSG